MATTQIVWGRAGSEIYGTPVPVFNAISATSESITPSGANQVSASSNTSAQRAICRVSTDTQIYVAFGPALTVDATVDTNPRFLVTANRAEMFEVAPGDYAAVTNG